MALVCNQMRMCWNEKPESRLTSLALLKILDKNYAELMPNMSKLVKNLQFLDDIQSSRKFLEVPRNDKILKFCTENQVP